MLTEREQKLVNWLRTRKVATRRQLQLQFQVCHMTVFRALKKVGYLTSYNHNAGFYTLADVPQFDDWGLWAYRDARFSRAGTLPDTLVALATQAPAGLTAGELEERLQTPVANLLSRLVQHGRLQRHVLRGRHVVFARLRQALRLSAEQMDQLRQPQELPPDEPPAMKQALEQLRQELRQQTADRNHPDGPLAWIVLKHLDKYWGHLVPEHPLAAGECWQRTTCCPKNTCWF